jgi:hypothetical protein
MDQSTAELVKVFEKAHLPAGLKFLGLVNRQSLFRCVCDHNQSRLSLFSSSNFVVAAGSSCFGSEIIARTSSGSTARTSGAEMSCVRATGSVERSPVRKARASSSKFTSRSQVALNSLVVFRKSDISLPNLRAISGIRRGPRKIKATMPIRISSCVPIDSKINRNKLLVLS